MVKEGDMKNGKMKVRFAGLEWEVSRDRFANSHWLIFDGAERLVDASPAWGDTRALMGFGWLEFVDFPDRVRMLMTGASVKEGPAVRFAVFVPGAGWRAGVFSGGPLPFDHCYVGGMVSL